VYEHFIQVKSSAGAWNFIDALLRSTAGDTIGWQVAVLWFVFLKTRWRAAKRTS